MGKAIKIALTCTCLVGVAVVFGVPESSARQQDDGGEEIWGIGTGGEFCEGECNGWPNICCDEAET